MRWPRYQHVIFDFDSTLTTIEGVDDLAAHGGASESVRDLTNRAMSGEVPLDEVYDRRLDTIAPTHADVLALRGRYKKNLTEDAAGVVAVLQALGHSVYIVSGGLREPIAEVAVSLGVRRENVHAVDVEYDELAGEWWRNDSDGNRLARTPYLATRRSALSTSDGKSQIVAGLLAGSSGRSMLVGDGATDLAASETVDLFVAYAGIVARENVIERAQLAIMRASLSALLPLAAGPHAGSRLADPEQRKLFEKGEREARTGALSFRDQSLARKFDSAMQHAAGH